MSYIVSIWRWVI